MTLDELRALLLRPAAVRVLESAAAEATHASVLDPGEALRIFTAGVESYADEAARTILQAQAAEDSKRDAAVREECARVADEVRIPFALTEDQDDGAGWMASTIADEIRARARAKVPPTGRGGGPTPHGEEAGGAAGDHVKGRESPSDPAPAPSASGDDRDAAVRALLASVEAVREAAEECPCSICKAAAAVRRFYPEGT